MKKWLPLFFVVSIIFVAAATQNYRTPSAPIPHFEVVLAENGDGTMQDGLTLQFTTSGNVIAVDDSAATGESVAPAKTAPPLTDEECATAQVFYESALAAKNSDTEALAYEAVHCGLSEGMDQDAAELLFKVYHLEKQDWVEQGKSLTWWRWKWRAADDKKKHRFIYATLEVDFKNRILQRSVLSLTTPKGSIRDTKGSL